MSDDMTTTTAAEHLAAIKGNVDRIKGVTPCISEDWETRLEVEKAGFGISHHAEAMVADLARLRSYALALQRQGVANGTIARLQVEHGVVELLRGDDRSSHRQDDQDRESTT